MGGMQMFLTIGALTLLTLLVLNVNKTIISNQDIEINSEAITTAAAVGQSLMNEITSKAFDERVLSEPVMDLVYATAPDSLGPEPGETRATFDDVDDFQNFTISDTTPRLGIFSIKSKVSYVDDDNPSIDLNAKSRTKLIRISVYNSSLKDTLKFYSYKSY